MSETAETLFYRRAVRRIYWNMVWLSAAGVLVSAWRMDWLWAGGFLFGALAAILNFRWLHRLAYAVGPGEPPRRKRLAFWLVFRYLLFGLGAYVIVRFFKVNLLAALAGLLVAAAAVLVEILYELIYART